MNGAKLLTSKADLEEVRFGVHETPMAFYPHDDYSKDKPHGPITDTRDYKCVVTDEGKLLSVVGKNYKLVRNAELIDALFDRLKETGIEWELGSQDSYYTQRRMRLHFTFPDLKLKDNEGDIPLALWVHNSYNQTEGVRISWGAMRLVCSNGMMIGKVLKRFYHKHSKGFYLPQMQSTFENAYRQIPVINDRIKLLETTKFNETDNKLLEDSFNESFLKKALEGHSEESLKNESKWFVINLLSYYISHTISLQQRAAYQQKLMKITGV